MPAGGVPPRGAGLGLGGENRVRGLIATGCRSMGQGRGHIRPPGRRKELVNILRTLAQAPDRYDGIVVYGSGKTDVNREVKDPMALLTKHGTKISFAR